jgi:hypothetical protein
LVIIIVMMFVIGVVGLVLMLHFFPHPTAVPKGIARQSRAPSFTMRVALSLPLVFAVGGLGLWFWRSRR